MNQGEGPIRNLDSGRQKVSHASHLLARSWGHRRLQGKGREGKGGEGKVWHYHPTSIGW